MSPSTACSGKRCSRPAARDAVVWMLGCWIQQPGSTTHHRHPQMKYTCREYRTEMTLLALRRRLKDESLSAAEKAELRRQIARLETEMGID